MSYLDRKDLISADLRSRIISTKGTIRYYNTDKNIAYIYMKLVTENEDGVEQLIQKEEASNYSVTITVKKPGNVTKDIIGVLSEDLVDETCAIYKFALTSEFTDQVNDYLCETVVKNDTKELVMDTFIYSVKADMLTGLNGEIIIDPDTSILKQLIEKVQKVNNINDVEISETETYSNKKIEEKFTGVDAQLNTIVQNKTDITTTDNIQQQVNNLVLGAVGDGNNAEVVQARGVYNTLNERFDYIDSSKLNKLLLKNIVLNSNLSSQTNWNFLLSDGTVINNECVFTATARYGSFYQILPNNPILGHKYYVGAKVKATSNLISLDYCESVSGSNHIRIKHSGSGNYELLSSIIQVSTNVLSRIRVLDDRSSGWNNISCKEFMLIDLTEMFGIGNEPTKEQFEELIYKNKTSYFVETNSVLNAISVDIFPKNEDKKQKYPLIVYKNNLDITLAWKYNSSKDIRIHIEPVGANGLYQVGRIAFVDNLGESVSDDFALVETIYQNAVTDWISPYIMKAINTGDGDKVGGEYDFVGGCHSYTNTASGIPTARLVTAKLRIDGSDITNNGIYYSNNVDLICTNRIQGNNTKKADGTGREILEEVVTFTVRQGEIAVDNKIKPLEDVRIDRYYGMQSYINQYKLDSGTVYYVNGKDNIIYPLGTSNGGTLTDGSTCRKMIVTTSNHILSMELDDIGLTKKRLITTTDNLAFWSNDKLYFQLINQYTTVTVGSMLYWSGKYKFTSS
ncbi:MAG TPA: hypothetical protein DDY58_07265 [Terrisporobacter glycolicus]|uniref:hypothetical protein n=1 Tax=Terrisporobacter TaxID=1505652 RepID=UPI000E83ADF5|nr:MULTISPECIES: hypothetical protein [Terrisporobacter]HBI92237.1 hypothetical protein [Terrisporobacter hibernicus]